MDGVNSLPLKKPVGTAGAAVNILAVGSGSVIDDLLRLLTHSRWSVARVETLTQSVAHLTHGWRGVLICEPALPDGTWKDMLTRALGLPWPPPLIVAATHADDALWMEVLESGGYNLIGKPFNEPEVFRTISAAWLRQRDRVRENLRAASGF
jgi:FixJ family two-component response regulator